MDVEVQLFTLAGVALGALATFVTGALSERARHRREFDDRWRERRLDCYAAYANDVKRLSVVARRMAAAQGLDDRAEPLAAEDGIPILTDAENQRTLAMEMLRLLADAQTAEAAHELNQAVWHLTGMARGRRGTATAEQWAAAMDTYIDAMNAFHAQARREIGVPGEHAARPLRPSVLREIGS